MKEIDKIAWIYLKDNKILSTLSKGKNKFYIPGGKRETGETDAQTLLREIKEELTVDIIPSSIKPMGIFTAQSDGATIGINVKMTCYFANYEGELKASSEIEKIVWLTFSDLDKISAVDKLIFQFLHSKELLD